MTTPPPAPPGPLEPPWEALEGLAAGTLPPEEAARWQAAVTATPGWPAALARCQALHSALGDEGLYPFPRSLALRILADTVGEPRLGLLGIVGRVAAGVALAVGAWSAWLGGAPGAPSAAALPSWARAPVDLPTADVWSAAPTLPSPAAPWAAAGAVGLLVAGVWLARRWGTGVGEGTELSRGDLS